ncbi:hypothetical protein [Thermosynechococcus vestitus]|uniref:Tlr1184 protein n=1 Tax=Thermosynechococcus vestitus (strain NIES-2133 / IAM M-273 / BP-1) TaxID=197221 RepID=Q8DJN8_THEVB|nr:hypothetical protein [Thermosynechococcus vestitus]BAC08736.1 tlr1184 [Thermosynechococcus vestitus BP-1]BAY51096.1 hypothetical protein NIES2134_113200 [Thermostichus vulcanus NIES-2134]
MKRSRPRPQVQAPSQNLDSFLDVLTNTVGVMIFVCLFASLTAAVSPALVRTPIARETRKQVYFFECRENRALPLEVDQASEAIDRHLRRVTDNPFAHPRQIQEQLESFRYRTRHYDVRLSLVPQGEKPILQTHFELRDRLGGEFFNTLEKPTSQFRRTLDHLSPAQHSLVFFVRPDSFDCFRAARAIAWRSGFDVGWEPMGEGRPIVFVSGGGRRVTVQ